MSIILLGIVLLYVFYKIIDSGDEDSDDLEDFIMMRDAVSIARGDNPFTHNGTNNEDNNFADPSTK